MSNFDYEKPELVDFTFGSAKGEGASCYVNCATDDLCSTGSDDI